MLVCDATGAMVVGVLVLRRTAATAAASYADEGLAVLDFYEISAKGYGGKWWGRMAGIKGVRS